MARLSVDRSARLGGRVDPVSLQILLASRKAALARPQSVAGRPGTAPVYRSAPATGAPSSTRPCGLSRGGVPW